MGMFDDLIPADKPSGPDYGSAIASIESGGKYHLLGPVTKTGDRAYGKYQVMGANIGPWSEEALGRRLTAQEFLADPKLQDEVFQHRFNQYVNKYGPEGASKAWFAGEKGMNNPNARDQLGTTVENYGRRFMKSLGGHPSAAAQPQQAPQPQAPQALALDSPKNPMETFVNSVVGQPSAASQPQQVAQRAAPQTGGLFDDLIPSGRTKITVNPVMKERFVDTPAPDNAQQLQAGLEQRATDMTTGPQQHQFQQWATEHGNILPAASQGVTPNMGVLRKNLISTETQERDDGAILFRDPQTGQVQPTDNTKHIAMRDPADGQVKVYAKTEQAIENPAVGAARTLAPGFLTGAPTRAMNVSQRTQTVPSLEQLKSTAGAGYQSAAVGELKMGAQELVPIIDRVKSTLSEMGLAQPVAKTTWELLEQAVNAPPGSFQTGKNIQALRASLSNAAKTPGTSDGKAAMTAKSIIDEMLPAVKPIEGDAAKVAELLKTADQNYSAFKDAKMLADKTYRGELRASSANSGMNAGNTIKQRLTDVLTTEKLRRGLTEEQIALAERIVHGNKSENTMRLIGNALGGGGGGAALVSGAAGGTAAAVSTGDPSAFLYGALLPLGGLTLRTIGNKITLNQADKLAKLLRSDSPLGKRMANPIKEWETAVKEFSQAKNARNVARLNIAARNLSNNLKDGGIVVSAGELLRSVTAHPGIRADENDSQRP